jgi:hypothetical protein
MVPLHDVPASLLVPETIRRAYLALTKRDLKMTRRDGRVRVNIPTVKCHQMVVFEY